MAENKRVTELDAISSLTAADVFYVVDEGNASKKITYANLIASIEADIDLGNIAGNVTYDNVAETISAQWTFNAGINLASGQTYKIAGVQITSAALSDVTAFAQTLLDDANAAAARTTLGLGSMATQAASAVAITGGTINGVTIGGTTPAAGTFTTVAASGQVTITNAGLRLETTSNGIASFVNFGLRNFGIQTSSPNAYTFTLDNVAAGDLNLVVKTNGTFGGTITSTGALTAASDTDTMNILGRAKIGGIGANDNLYLAHFDHFSTTSYALRQASTGRTVINAASGQDVSIAIDNTDVATFLPSAVIVDADLRVNGGDIGTTSDPDLLQITTNFLTVNGLVHNTFGPYIAGASGTTRGWVACYHGSGGNTPGHVVLYSANGTNWYLFVEDDGTLKIHNSTPSANSDGTVVGSQT